MGETAAKLRLIFDAMITQRGVYFFDEFDAIGADRVASNDVGEIRRVLNSFLQFLEQDDSDSLIIAATNHMKMLDPALFRRFDDVIRYELPSRHLAQELMLNRLAVFGIDKIDWGKVSAITDGLSYAEIARACDDAAREVVLSDERQIRTELLIGALKDRSEKSHV
jgi:SpoVK/Ycf46/Vps4 family AAA+-type ATPase